MTETAASPSDRATLRADSWTYASGRVAALEGMLLGRDALERLAEADSSTAVSSALAESPLRGSLSETEGLAQIGEAISTYYSAALGSLQDDCPFPAMFELVAVPARFGALKDRVRTALKEGGAGDVSSDAARELLGEFGADSEAAVGLRLLLGLLAVEDCDRDLAINLALDSGRLLETLRLAESLGDEDVLAHVRDEVAVRATLVLWRSKLVAADDPDDTAAELVPRLFLRGALAEGLPALLWPRPFIGWEALIADELTVELGGELFGSGEEEKLNAWEKAAFDWLTTRARLLRGQAFGVGRVYGYAWGLAIEERNVRLACIGRARGVTADAVKKLFLEGYA